MRPRVLLLSATLLAACGGRDDAADVKVSFDASPAAVADEMLAAGDVRVTSTDGAFIMALVGDSVRMQLSDSLRQHVKQEIDSSADSGIGGSIARSVSGIVGNALGFVVRIPVRDIEDIRYEDGKIKFETRGSSKVSVNGSNGGNGGKAEFSKADGERFVAAVKARQAALK